MADSVVAIIGDSDEEERELSQYGDFLGFRNGQLIDTNLNSKITEIRTRQVRTFPDKAMQAIEVIVKARNLGQSSAELYVKDAEARAMNGLIKKLIMTEPTPEKKITWGDVMYKAKHELMNNYFESMKEAVENLPEVMDKFNKYLGKTLLGPLNPKNNANILSSFKSWSYEISRTIFPEIEDDSFMPSDLDEMIYNFKQIAKAYTMFNFELLRREYGDEPEWVKSDFDNSLTNDTHKISPRLEDRINEIEHDYRRQKEKNKLFNHNSPYSLLKNIIPFLEKLKTVKMIEYDLALRAEYGRKKENVRLDEDFFERYDLAPDRVFVKTEVLPRMKESSKKRFKQYYDRLGGKEFLGDLYPMPSPEDIKLAQRYIGLTNQFEFIGDQLDRMFTKLVSDNLSGLKSKATFERDRHKPIREIRGKYSRVLGDVYIKFQEGKNISESYGFKDFYDNFQNVKDKLSNLRSRFEGLNPSDKIHSELVRETLSIYSELKDSLVRSYGLVRYGLFSRNGMKLNQKISNSLEELKGNIYSLENQLYGVAV